MSGSSRRRNSKWDHKDSEALPEAFHERPSVRKPRELLSPSRASRRHDSRGKESMLPWDREGNGARMSPGLDDWSDRHYGRSPKNDWRLSYRSRSRTRSRSRSRSRSWSRSPAHNSRREPAGNDRSRGRSGVSELICRDFSAGRCRRGSHCQFLHEEVELYDSGRPLKNSSPDELDIRHRRTRGSRYSPDDVKDYAVRGERSANLCNDFLKGNCRRGSSCRYAHDTAPDVIEKGPVDDVYRERDNDHRTRDTYPDRNHDCEPPKRGETPLCKFFAAGNCRNGKRCRFSHQVQEGISPERRAQRDSRGPDHKFENDPVWDGPTWSDATRMSDISALPAWGQNKNETTEIANEMTTVRSRDDPWSHDIINNKQTWDPSVGLDESKTRDEGQAPQWKTENCVPSIENFSGDMEISPRDVLKLQNFGSPNPQTLSNVSFPAVQQSITGETSYEKCYPHASHDQKVFNDSYSGLNPNFKDDMPSAYPREGRNGIGNDDNTRLTSNPMMNAPPAQNIFQSDPRINLQPISSIDPSAGQGQLHFPPYHCGSDGMQMKTSHNTSSFLDGKVADGPHLAVNASSVALAPSTKSNAVSSEQLAQLSHLTASLAQLLESRQLPQSTSGVTPNGISSYSDFQASNPTTSGATFLPNQAPDMLKQYDPISDSAEPKLLHDSTPHTFTSLAEQRSSEKEPLQDSGNVDQQEHNREASKDDENGGKATEGGSKAPENGPSEDMGVDDGADDGKKSKDSKGIRAFKFALADFVKELLKPTWKDGQVSKEVYKAIVKKVVDKVIETQGPQIPQAKEKIDQYLSYSKPKLDKLVQAYVGKYQKGKV